MLFLCGAPDSDLRGPAPCGKGLLTHPPPWLGCAYRRPSQVAASADAPGGCGAGAACCGHCELCSSPGSLAPGQPWHLVVLSSSAPRPAPLGLVRCPPTAGRDAKTSLIDGSCLAAPAAAWQAWATPRSRAEDESVTTCPCLEASTTPVHPRPRPRPPQPRDLSLDTGQEGVEGAPCGSVPGLVIRGQVSLCMWTWPAVTKTWESPVSGASASCRPVPCVEGIPGCGPCQAFGDSDSEWRVGRAPAGVPV